MNPSLPSLPVVAGRPDPLPGAAEEIQSNQSGTGSAGGFKGLLGEAHAALSLPAQSQPGVSQGAEQLLGELQTLPQDGKLLPLLQRTLHQLADSGGDPRKFIAQLNARLEVLAQNSELQPDERLAAALHHVIQEQPALKSVLPSQALALVADNKAAQQHLNNGAAGATSNGFVEQARKAADPGIDPDQVTHPVLAKPHKPAQPDLLVQPALMKETRSATLENTLSQLQQPASPEQRQPELAVLMTALKRMIAGNRSVTAAVENTVRPDSPITGAASPALAATAAQAHASTAASGMPTVSVSNPLGQAGWDQALGERIQWMAGQKMHGAQVRLNPANLGPMEVRIQVHNDQASVQFTAHHAVVREALEAALPRLRDMFEASGVELVDVDVSSGESFAEQQQAMQDASKPQWNKGIEAEEVSLDTRLETPLAGLVSQGYLDLFA